MDNVELALVLTKEVDEPLARWNVPGATPQLCDLHRKRVRHLKKVEIVERRLFGVDVELIVVGNANHPSPAIQRGKDVENVNRAVCR